MAGTEAILSPATLRATTLTFVAGIADAVGFLTMGGVFAANMTGNTVLAGIALARLDAVQAWHHLAPLAAFFAGAVLSRLLLRLTDSPRAGLLVEAAILAGVGFLPLGQEVSVVIVAMAMGIQASAITHFARAAVSTVVVTSTLARTADAVLDGIWRGATDGAPVATNPRLLALTWLGYLVGAVTGGLLLAVFAWPLLLPAALLVLLAIRPTSAA
jgi:uncharacterized membrane protein YoaK (UPF0700 family)